MDSPCTLVCTIEPKSGWCHGCGRTLDEIAGWGGASEAVRRAVWAELPTRMANLERQGARSRPPLKSAM